MYDIGRYQQYFSQENTVDEIPGKYSNIKLTLVRKTDFFVLLQICLYIKPLAYIFLNFIKNIWSVPNSSMLL